jgi:hypothetical protein
MSTLPDLWRFVRVASSAHQYITIVEALFIGVILTVSCLPFVAAAADVAVTEKNVATFYRDFHRLTKQPHRIAPLTGFLCRTPTPADYEWEKKQTGPHHHKSIHLYANPSAMRAVTNEGGVFPVGSVIVKEKFINTNQIDGIGGMIKRTPGFDPTNGDWEYFYYSVSGTLTLGRLQNCIDCHRGARTNDYVFSVWDYKN